MQLPCETPWPLLWKRGSEGPLLLVHVALLENWDIPNEWSDLLAPELSKPTELGRGKKKKTSILFGQSI